MSRNNIHTHTVFCDGKDTPEELVKYAIECGCRAIGFSGHSFTDIPDVHSFCMTKEGTEEYKREINRLKLLYKDKIKILLGVEQDYFSECATDDYEYIIGSVHYILKDGRYISVDESEEAQKNAVDQYYGGDYYAFIEDYYSLVGKVYEKTKCDIIGHFDLVTKFNEDNRLFDISDPRYIASADKALEKLLSEKVAFEVNYGAIARGYRKTPYPDDRILEKIIKANKPVIYTSDCHSKEMLLFGIPENG